MLKQFPKLEDRIRHWSSLSKQCANSGIYESRLGTLLTQAGLYEKAKQAIEAGLALKTSYRKELLSTLAGVDLSQQNLEHALQGYEAIIRSYPDWYDGYSGVGAVKLMQGKFDEAVHYLNEAARREQHLHIYRNLTIAYPNSDATKKPRRLSIQHIDWTRASRKIATPC